MTSKSLGSFGNRPSRGSVLLVALLFAGLIAVSLVSYISLTTNSLKQASRSFYASSGINLAEIGLEQALACFNQLDDTTPENAWTGWTLNSAAYDAISSPFTPAATRTFPEIDVGPGAKGTVKVFAQHYKGGNATTTPIIVAVATITQAGGPPIQKYIEVKLRKRSVLGYGVSAIDDITVNGGNFQGKSWDSDPSPEDGVLEAFTEAKNTENLIMGSVQGDINLGAGGEVWGYTKVSSETHSDVGGSVHGEGAAGTADDPERRTEDFDGSFPMKYPPSYAFNTINTDIVTGKTFPLYLTGEVTDTIKTGYPNAGETVYVYKFAAGASIEMTGSSDHLVIEDGKNVIFIFENHAGETTVKVAGGSAQVRIGTESSLNIYTNGNVDITGSGVVNPNIDAKSFMLWGTNPTSPPTQDIKVAGNGQFTGVIYAPNADIWIKGGGSDGQVVGAIVGKTVSFNGTTNFYYDEELSELTIGNPYGASQWKELQTETERSFYAAVLSF